MKRLLLLALISLSLTACYRIPIQQGNMITASSAASIKPGMSKQQVVSRLGYPVLTNMFKNGQEIYVYTFKPGVGRYTAKKLVVYMRGGRVVRVTSDMHMERNRLPTP